ncbi:MAG: hypothetical protein JWQ79_1951 [Mucilaginibacter sp.]|nr:hypothetical protein [Mucilaginibacter sp.]
MKKRIILGFAILCSFVIFGFKTFATFGISTSNIHDNIRVIFTNKMTLDDLVKIKRDLHKTHIDISYKNIAFDEKDLLKSISFSVDCHDGFKGSAESNRLGNNARFGFYRDYSKKSLSPFGTGQVDEPKK